MTLTTCSECKAEVSDQAGKCPKCGAKIKKPTSRITLFIAGLIAISVAKCAVDYKPTPEPPPKSAQQIEQDTKEEAQFQADVLKIKALRASTKNPDSFKLVGIARMSDGTLCVIYRGTNSFNAIITEQKAILPGAKIGDWNKSCAGKSGEDMKRIEYAL